MSVNISHIFFSTLQSSSGIFHFIFIHCFSFVVGNWNSIHSCNQLFAFIISWVVVENSVSSKDNGLNEFSESWVFWFVTNGNFIIWLSFSLVSFMSLQVGSSINSSSVIEHVGDSHSVLSKSTCLIRANARS